MAPPKLTVILVGDDAASRLVIDVGINRLPNGKIVGDVNFGMWGKPSRYWPVQLSGTENRNRHKALQNPYS